MPSEAASNPYSSPEEFAATTQSDAWTALRGYRLALLILAIPTALNYLFWDRENLAGRFAGDLVALCRTVNITLLVTAFAALFLIGLPLLRLGLKVLLPLFPVPEWEVTANEGLSRLPIFAALGSALWVVWSIGFYVLQLRGMAFSTTLALLGHLLAVFWYFPIFSGWYAAFRQVRAQQHRDQ